MASSSWGIRVVWTVIVLLGFTIAGFLIWQSLDNWQHDPVDTTISTHPIEQVTFPKIYVCPPKHTYTNLNYDIAYTKNVYLNDEQIKAMKAQVDESIQVVEQDQIMREVDKIEEKNKFFNWYSGLTKLSKPFMSTYLEGGIEFDKLTIYTVSNVKNF